VNTASNQSPSQPGWAPGQDASGDPVAVFVINGVRTSDGPGPGVRHVPPAEASALIAARTAVAGDKPPPNWPG
jgi:hypothetical protein